MYSASASFLLRIIIKQREKYIGVAHQVSMIIFVCHMANFKFIARELRKNSQTCLCVRVSPCKIISLLIQHIQSVCLGFNVVASSSNFLCQTQNRRRRILV